jgi:hypothetical protein
VAAACALAAGCLGDAGRKEQAKNDLQAIDRALVAYKGKHGSWPDRLDQLAEPPDGGAGFLAQASLTDPWGRPYEYDRWDTHSTSGQPAVWSQGPTPGDAASKIANWAP